MSEKTTTIHSSSGDYVVHGDRQTRLAVELGSEWSKQCAEVGVWEDNPAVAAREACMMSAVAAVLAKYLPPEEE